MVKVVSDPEAFKQKALQWASKFDVVCYLDPNNFKDKYSKFDTLIAAGAKHQLEATAGNAFDQLATFRKLHPGLITGFFGYDLKNETETLSSENPDHLHFPDLYFFAPQYLLIINGNEVEITGYDDNKLFDLIAQQELPDLQTHSNINIRSRFSKAEYITTVKNIQDHIINAIST